MFTALSSILLLTAMGIDSRKVGQEWALNQLIHNYAEECFLHLFITWAFTLGKTMGCKSPGNKALISEVVDNVVPYVHLSNPFVVFIVL